MSLLSPRLQLKLAQKQILTPSLLQMVTVLQLNRLELPSDWYLRLSGEVTRIFHGESENRATAPKP